MTPKLTIVAVTFGLVIGLAIWPSDGDARKCTGPGFRCNSPEGCELQAQMLGKWGFRAVFRNNALAAQARTQAEAKLASQRSNPNWNEMVDTEAFNSLSDAAKAASAEVRIAACPGSTIASPPGMSVKYDEYTRKCKVVVEVNGREHPANKAYELVPTTCDEMIDASRVHEGHHMDNCSKTKTLTASRKEEVAGYTLEIQYLRDEMKHVGKWCTPSPARRKRFTDHLTAATASLLRQQGAQQ